jgi:hypothetical protein
MVGEEAEEVQEDLKKIENYLSAALIRLQQIGNGMVVHEINNALQCLEGAKMKANQAAKKCRSCAFSKGGRSDGS